MQLSHAARVKGSVLLLAAAALASVLTTLSRADVTDGVRISRTEMDGRRLAPLRAILPQRGVVGYVSDTSGWELRTIRYFLAPLIIQRGTNHDIIIGTFDEGSAPAEFLAARGLVVTRDLGDGILLLTRSTKK